MTSLKWANVAHMYGNTTLEIHIFGTDLAKGMPLITRTTNPEDLYRFMNLWSSDRYTVKPVLRHLDDMSEVEARELHLLTWGNQIKIGSGSFEWESGLSWFDDYAGNYSPSMLFWLISKGFDVFGLIEAGEAIRAHKDQRQGDTC